MASIVLLHEEALRMEHPVFKAAGAECRTVFIWDDAYFRRADYSLKRLIFIYETLCALPTEVVAGETAAVIKALGAQKIFIPYINNPLLRDEIEKAVQGFNVEWVEDEPFVVLKKPLVAKRFFQYWNKIEARAFLKNGGADA